MGEKIVLNFFGKGAAFADDNTCAYFVDDNDMVLIDFSLEAFPKFRRLDFADIKTIYVLVTHTHGDHISGIGTLIHYAYYVLRLPVIVITPSNDISDSLHYLFDKIEGCHKNAYSIVSANNLNMSWFISPIPTKHADTLDENCFGYGLLIEKCLIVYTGDTKTLDPFIIFIKSTDIPKKRLYTEISAYKSDVHLFIDDNLDTLIDLQQNGTEVYLMHLDDEEVTRDKIRKTNLKIVETI